MTDTAFARQRDSSLTRFLGPIGAVVGIAVIVGGILVLSDPLAGQNMLAAIFDLLGNDAGARLLRLNTGPDLGLAKLILALVALVVGVGGVWMLYVGASSLVGLLPPRLQGRIIPWVFITPALLLLGTFLVYPTIATFYASFTQNLTGGDPLTHYRSLTDAATFLIFRNNLIWLVVGTAGSVGLGLVIAAMVDRVRREALAKTFIFLPLAISLVGASVIWRFVYQWTPPTLPQYGLLNAAVTSTGAGPVQWIQDPSWNVGGFGIPLNTLALVVIFVWLQTGFAMVVLSAAIKGVSVEVLEAARLDGASERQTFFRIIIPIIKGSIITVATTIAIAVLKIFDIVYVMTGGRFETDVVANAMYLEKFRYFNDGRAAALAVVLFLAVSPILVLNVRNLRRQGIGA